MALVRVFRIPPPINGFVFGGAAQSFVNVDWFRDDGVAAATQEEWESALRAFIARKSYYQGETPPLLVLGDRWSFTIGYSAP